MIAAFVKYIGIMVSCFFAFAVVLAAVGAIKESIRKRTKRGIGR